MRLTRVLDFAAVAFPRPTQVCGTRSFYKVISSPFALLPFCATMFAWSYMPTIKPLAFPIFPSFSFQFPNAPLSPTSSFPCRAFLLAYEKECNALSKAHCATSQAGQLEAGNYSPYYLAIRPPSKTKLAPVMKSLALLARKMTVPRKSSGRPHRPAGVRPMM